MVNDRPKKTKNRDKNSSSLGRMKVKNVAKVNKAVNNYNIQHGTSITYKDIHNHLQKLNKCLQLDDDDALENI